MNLLSFKKRFSDADPADAEKLMGYIEALDDLAGYIEINKFDFMTDKRLDAKQLALSLAETAADLKDILMRMEATNNKMLSISDIISQAVKKMTDDGK